MKSWAVNSLIEMWSDVFRYRWALIALLIVALMARGQAITEPMYSIDGYSFLDSPEKFTHLLMSNGRFGLVAFLWLRTKIGYVGMGVVPSALILSTALFIAAGFLYARVILTKIGTAELLIVISLFALHPYNTEFFTFSDATLGISLPIFLSAAGLACMEAIDRPWLSTAAGSLLIFVALSIYQLVLAHVTVACLLSIAARMACPDKTYAMGGRWWWRPLSMPPVRSLLMITGVFVALLLTTLLVSRISGIALAGRAEMSGLPDPKEKLAALGAATALAFWPNSGLIPQAISVLLIGILALATISIVLSVGRRSGVCSAFAALLILALATICSVAIPVAAHTVWLVPRVVSPFSLLIAGVTALGWRYAPKMAVRPWVAGALVVILIAYVGSSNRILYDQHRVNLWDAQDANRMVQRFEANPHYDDMRTLVLIHGNWRRTSPLPTITGDMNVSAFEGQYSKFGVIEQATGLRFAAPTPAESAVAEQYCASASVWPGADSVTIVGNLGIICLKRSE